MCFLPQSALLRTRMSHSPDDRLIPVSTGVTEKRHHVLSRATIEASLLSFFNCLRGQVLRQRRLISLVGRAHLQPARLTATRASSLAQARQLRWVGKHADLLSDALTSQMWLRRSIVSTIRGGLIESREPVARFAALQMKSIACEHANAHPRPLCSLTQIGRLLAIEHLLRAPHASLFLFFPLILAAMDASGGLTQTAARSRFEIETTSSVLKAR